MCIRLTRFTLVCEVIRYHLVQVRQNLKKKTFRVGGPESPFSISSSFILFFVLLPFFLLAIQIFVLFIFFLHLCVCQSACACTCRGSCFEMFSSRGGHCFKLFDSQRHFPSCSSFLLLYVYWPWYPLSSLQCTMILLRIRSKNR